MASVSLRVRSDKARKHGIIPISAIKAEKVTMMKNTTKPRPLPVTLLHHQPLCLRKKKNSPQTTKFSLQMLAPLLQSIKVYYT